MTKRTTSRQRDSANTDLPQFHDPDDQVIGPDTDDPVAPDETDIQHDLETETVEIDPDEAAVRAYFATHDANSSKHSPSPPGATCSARNRSGTNPKTTWPRWTTQYGCTSAKSDAFHSSPPGRRNTWHVVSTRWHTCTRSPD